MSTTTKKLSAGLVGLLLGGAALASAAPAQAHGHGFGGFGHHGGWGWGRSYGYVSYAPAYYGGCYLKRFVTIYDDIVYRRVCY
jgi:hypothetical protein